MKIEITPSLEVAEILKSKACTHGSSRGSLIGGGMASLAAAEMKNVARPATDWMKPVIVEIGSRDAATMIPSDRKTQENTSKRNEVFKTNLAAAALYELGFRLASAVRLSGKVKIKVVA